MKVANPYENCKRPGSNHTPKSENCKLIWKLLNDMKIANQYENCKAILTFRCMVPTWTFAIFKWETQRDWKLLVPEMNFLVGLRRGWQKTHREQSLAKPSTIHILSDDSSTLMGTAGIHIKSQGISWTSHRFWRDSPLTPPMSVSSHTYKFISHFQISAFYFRFFSSLYLNFGCDSKNGSPQRKTTNRQKLDSFFHNNVHAHRFPLDHFLVGIGIVVGEGGRRWWIIFLEETLMPSWD